MRNPAAQLPRRSSCGAQIPFPDSTSPARPARSGGRQLLMRLYACRDLGCSVPAELATRPSRVGPCQLSGLVSLFRARLALACSTRRLTFTLSLAGDGDGRADLTWFSAGLRVGMGVGLGMCIGVGLGVRAFSRLRLTPLPGAHVLRSAARSLHRSGSS